MSNDDEILGPQAMKRRRRAASELQTSDQPTAKRVRGSQDVGEFLDQDEDVATKTVPNSRSQSGNSPNRTMSYFTPQVSQTPRPREDMSQVANSQSFNEFDTGTVPDGQDKGKGNKAPTQLSRKTSTVLSRMMKTYQVDLSQYSGRNQLADQTSGGDDDEEYDPPRLARGGSVQPTGHEIPRADIAVETCNSESGGIDDGVGYQEGAVPMTDTDGEEELREGAVIATSNSEQDGQRKGSNEGETYLDIPATFPERNPLDWEDNLEPMVWNDDPFDNAAKELDPMHSDGDEEEDGNAGDGASKQEGDGAESDSDDDEDWSRRNKGLRRSKRLHRRPEVSEGGEADEDHYIGTYGGDDNGTGEGGDDDNGAWGGGDDDNGVWGGGDNDVRSQGDGDDNVEGRGSGDDDLGAEEDSQAVKKLTKAQQKARQRAEQKAEKTKKARTRAYGEEDNDDGQNDEAVKKLTKAQMKAQQRAEEKARNIKEARTRAFGEEEDDDVPAPRPSRVSAKKKPAIITTARESSLRPDWREMTAPPPLPNPKKSRKRHENDLSEDPVGGFNDDDVEQHRPTPRPTAANRQIVEVLPFRDLRPVQRKPAHRQSNPATSKGKGKAGDFPSSTWNTDFEGNDGGNHAPSPRSSTSLRPSSSSQRRQDSSATPVRTSTVASASSTSTRGTHKKTPSLTIPTNAASSSSTRKTTANAPLSSARKTAANTPSSSARKALANAPLSSARKTAANTPSSSARKALADATSSSIRKAVAPTPSSSTRSPNANATSSSIRKAPANASSSSNRKATADVTSVRKALANTSSSSDRQAITNGSSKTPSSRPSTSARWPSQNEDSSDVESLPAFDLDILANTRDKAKGRTGKGKQRQVFEEPDEDEDVPDEDDEGSQEGDDIDDDNDNDDNDVPATRRYRNTMDEDPDNISLGWQVMTAKRKDLKATLFHFMGLRPDPFVIDQNNNNQLRDLIQKLIDLVFPHKRFVVDKQCVLYRKLRQAILSWRRYFLISGTRTFSAHLRRKKLARCSNGIVSYISEQKQGEVSELATTMIADGSAFYKTPNEVKELSIGPYQSHFVITTFINAYTKKLGGSLLPKLYKQNSWPFPYGAFLLAIYGVHLAILQFDTGEFISSSFTSHTAPNILEGHEENIAVFTKEDEEDFLEAVDSYAPRSARTSGRQSQAFSFVPVIVSFRRR